MRRCSLASVALACRARGARRERQRATHPFSTVVFFSFFLEATCATLESAREYSVSTSDTFLKKLPNSCVDLRTSSVRL